MNPCVVTAARRSIIHLIDLYVLMNARIDSYNVSAKVITRNSIAVVRLSRRAGQDRSIRIHPSLMGWQDLLGSATVR